MPPVFPGSPGSSKNCRNPGFRFFTTNCFSEKVRHLQSHQKCALFFLNPEEIHGLTLYGKAFLSDDKALKTELRDEDWDQFYPGGVNRDDYGLLLFIPESARGWYWDHPVHFHIGGKSL
jgi:general stress protein 26